MTRRAHRSSAAHDPTVYPEEERVGEDMLQRWIAELLRPLLQRWLTEQGKTCFVGADQFIYWEQHNAHKRIAPDVYVLPNVAPGTRVRVWKVWESGVVPSFALEVASRDWAKDYFEAPEVYGVLGVREVVVFDPDYETRPRGVRWQVFRRVARRGLVRVAASNGDRVRSRVLGCWLRAAGEDERLRVRLAVGPSGDELVPTDAERAEAERQRADADARSLADARARIRELEAQLGRRARKPRRG